jgi:hypothetical protein
MIDAALRQFVRNRAGHRCEYCRIRQSDELYFRFHIEHIIARQHQGTDDSENLALACHRCNLHKGPNLTGIDPQTGEVVAIFHPRKQRWNEHFALEGAAIMGLTQIGRATVQLLRMNDVVRIQLRSEVRSI